MYRASKLRVWWIPAFIEKWVPDHSSCPHLCTHHLIKISTPLLILLFFNLCNNWTLCSSFDFVHNFLVTTLKKTGENNYTLMDAGPGVEVFHDNMLLKCFAKQPSLLFSFIFLSCFINHLKTRRHAGCSATWISPFLLPNWRGHPWRLNVSGSRIQGIRSQHIRRLIHTILWVHPYR